MMQIAGVSGIGKARLVSKKHDALMLLLAAAWDAVLPADFPSQEGFTILDANSGYSRVVTILEVAYTYRYEELVMGAVIPYEELPEQIKDFGKQWLNISSQADAENFVAIDPNRRHLPSLPAAILSNLGHKGGVSLGEQLRAIDNLLHSKYKVDLPREHDTTLAISDKFLAIFEKLDKEELEEQRESVVAKKSALRYRLATVEALLHELHGTPLPEDHEAAYVSLHFRREYNDFNEDALEEEHERLLLNVKAGGLSLSQQKASAEDVLFRRHSVPLPSTHVYERVTPDLLDRFEAMTEEELRQVIEAAEAKQSSLLHRYHTLLFMLSQRGDALSGDFDPKYSLPYFAEGMYKDLDKEGLTKELDRVRAIRSPLRSRLAAVEFQMATLLGQSAEEAFLGHEDAFVTKHFKDVYAAWGDDVERLNEERDRIIASKMSSSWYDEYSALRKLACKKTIAAMNDAMEGEGFPGGFNAFITYLNGKDELKAFYANVLGEAQNIPGIELWLQANCVSLLRPVLAMDRAEMTKEQLDIVEEIKRRAMQASYQGHFPGRLPPPMSDYYARKVTMADCPPPAVCSWANARQAFAENPHTRVICFFMQHLRHRDTLSTWGGRVFYFDDEAGRDAHEARLSELVERRQKYKAIFLADEGSTTVHTPPGWHESQEKADAIAELLARGIIVDGEIIVTACRQGAPPNCKVGNRFANIGAVMAEFTDGKSDAQTRQRGNLVLLLRRKGNFRTWQKMELEFVETDEVKAAKAAAAAQAKVAMEEVAAAKAKAKAAKQQQGPQVLLLGVRNGNGEWLYLAARDAYVAERLLGIVRGSINMAINSLRRNAASILDVKERVAMDDARVPTKTWNRNDIPVGKVCSQVPACNDDTNVKVFIAAYDMLLTHAGFSRPPPPPAIRAPG